MQFTNCASDGRTDSNSTNLVDMFLVHRSHAAPPVVGVGVDDVRGDVTTEVLNDTPVSGSVAEVCREEVPEVVRRDVLLRASALSVPALLPGARLDEVVDHIRRESLPPLTRGADEQRVTARARVRSDCEPAS